MGFPQYSQIIHRVFLEYSYTVPGELLQNSQDNYASTIPIVSTTAFPQCSISDLLASSYYSDAIPTVFAQYYHGILTVFPECFHGGHWHRHGFPMAIPVLFP